MDINKYKEVIAFINTLSGGHDGVKLYNKLCCILGTDHVFDLAKWGPEPGLKKYQHVRGLRILSCGGDGTIGWVLSAIDNVGFRHKPKVAPLPLGTGNDMSRVLHWGNNYTGQPLLSWLDRVVGAVVVKSDRWGITFVPLTSSEIAACERSRNAFPSPRPELEADLASSIPIMTYYTKKPQVLDSLCAQDDSMVYKSEISPIMASKDDICSLPGRYRAIRIPERGVLKLDWAASSIPNDIAGVPSSVSNSALCSRLAGKYNVFMGSDSPNSPDEEGAAAQPAKHSPPSLAAAVLRWHGEDNDVTSPCSSSSSSSSPRRRPDSPSALSQTPGTPKPRPPSGAAQSMASPSRCAKLGFSPDARASLSPRNVADSTTTRPRRLYPLIRTDAVGHLLVRSDGAARAMDLANARLSTPVIPKSLTPQAESKWRSTSLGRIKGVNGLALGPKTPPEHDVWVPRVMNNYFSLGVDSLIALDFHKARQTNPGLFSHHVINKAWYGIYGIKTAFTSTLAKPLHKLLSLELDDEAIVLPRQLQALVFLQIPSYSSGTKLWGDPSKMTTKGGLYLPPRLCDQRFEVVGLKGVMHLSRLQTGLSYGIRIGQASRAIITNWAVLPVQCDGEPWMLPPSRTVVTFKNTSNLLFNYQDSRHLKRCVSLVGEERALKAILKTRRRERRGDVVGTKRIARRLRESHPVPVIQTTTTTASSVEESRDLPATAPREGSETPEIEESEDRRRAGKRDRRSA